MDGKRSGRPPKCTDVEKEWIIGAARQKPVDPRLAAPVRSVALLARHAKKSAGSARLPEPRGDIEKRCFQDFGQLENKAF